MKHHLLFFVMAACLCLTDSATAQTLKPVVDQSFVPFNVGEIKPEGWLKDWAQTAAKGMTRALGERYFPFNPGWANAKMGGWWPYEQAGYYADGVVRLAYILNDSTLMARAKDIMDAVVARQTPDGYCNVDEAKARQTWNTTEEDGGLLWTQAVFGRAAVAYYTATGDKKVLNMLEKVYAHFPVFQRTVTDYPLSGDEMQNLRKLVNIEVMVETARLAGDKDLVKRALDVFDPFKEAYLDSWVRKGDFSRTSICHGVTYNELSKLPAVVYPWNNDKDCLSATEASYDFLDKYFVLPNGVNSSNEYLRGIGAFEGAETCDISDFIWSNIWLARASGLSLCGDRIEKAFFNAFPGVMSPDFNLHMYEAGMNRIPGLHLRYRDDGDCFKELHWPACCSGNLNRILPNYIVNMCMENSRHELMMLTYGPARLQTRDGRFDIDMQTEYPFRDEIKMVVNAIPAQEILLLRVPSWCESPVCSVNGKVLKVKRNEAGFLVVRRSWKRGDVLSLSLPMKLRVDEGVEKFALFEGKETYWGSGHDTAPKYAFDGFHDGAHFATVGYGPLLFALPLYDKTDWGFDLNEGAWQEFRFALSKDALKDASVQLNGPHKPFYWAKDYFPPITVTLNLGKIQWEPDKGDPRLPVTCPAPYASQRVTLLPYGCTRYRLAMFPCGDK
jgi:hypothetical protein